MAIPIIGDLINGVKDLVSEVVVDKDKRDQVNLELKKLEDQAQARLDAQVTGQIEVNKVEAASSSVFVAGWRPAVGWVGAIGLGYNAVLQPVMSWTASVVFDYSGGYPVVNNELLLYILGGMLGLGSMRTFEKYKGVATNGYEVQPVGPSAPATVEVSANAKTGEVSVETTPASSAIKKSKWKL